jgi:butyryl-CoA dehydrogenase
MNLELNEDQLAIQQAAREFARSVVAPRAKAIDETKEWPADVVAACAEMGFMGVAVPEEWGGSALDTVSYAIIVEELSAACASTGVIVSVNNSLACDPILDWGTDELRRKYLEPMAQGRLLGCYALSEPASGSDAAGLLCTAVRDGDHYVVNGTKNFITNGTKADVCVLYATTDKAAGNKGVLALVAEADFKGYSIGAEDAKMGIRASGSCQIHFEDCRIPVSSRLAGEGDGFKVAMRTLDGGRIGIAAQAVGIGRAAFEDALEYSKQRKTFGKPISEHQAIQFMLADMATELDAARLLTWKAAAAKDERKKDFRKRWSLEASTAKLFASEACNRAADSCVQIFGGYGYVGEYPAERHYRDARITEIYEGTSEIQRIVIAADVLRRQ